jgi:hypothetical protein
MRAITAGVDDPLGNPLVVKVKNLLPKMKIFEEGGATRPNL